MEAAPGARLHLAGAGTVGVGWPQTTGSVMAPRLRCPVGCPMGTPTWLVYSVFRPAF
jgi:hypothetical protein